jgi:hypothetical protein
MVAASQHHGGGAMAVDFRTVGLDVPSGTGRKRIFGSTTFPSNVNRAAVTLNGYKVDFANDDHHLNVIEIDVDLGGHPSPAQGEPPPPPIEGNLVRFTGECQYADKNFDDSYSGFVSVTVMVDRN